MEIKDFKYVTVISNDDYVVSDHRVHGVRIMPGVTFLDMLLRILKSEGIDESAVELRNIIFQEAIATTEDYDRRIEVSLVNEHSRLRVTVKSQRIYHPSVGAADSPWDINFMCELNIAAPAVPRMINIDQLKADAVTVRDLDDAYAYTRQVNITHYEFMKGLGQVYDGEGYILAEVHLSDLAAEYNDSFYIHPVYLDCSTLVPVLFMLKSKTLADISQQHDKPFIPIFVESFRASGKMLDKAYVYVRENGVSLSSSKDIIYFDIELYDGLGNLVALFHRLASKQIRSEGLMHKHEEALAPQVQPPRGSSIEAPKNAMIPPEVPQSEEQQTDRLQLLEQEIQEMVGEVAGVAAHSISLEEGFYDQGLDSSQLLLLVRKLEDKLQMQLYPTLLFEFSNIKQLAVYLAENSTEGLKISSNPPQQVLQNSEVKRFYYSHNWVKLAPLPSEAQQAEGRLMIFTADDGLGSSVERSIAARMSASASVITVHPGKGFERVDDQSYRVRPGNREDYKVLIQYLNSIRQLPQFIIHLWEQSAAPNDDVESMVSDNLEYGLYSLHALTQALLEQKLQQGVKLIYAFINDGKLQSSLDSAISGYMRCVTREKGDFKYKALEMDAGSDLSGLALTDILLRELTPQAMNESEIKYMSGQRYTRHYQPFAESAQNPASAADPGARLGAIIEKQDTILITGGLGGLGWIFAKYLAVYYQAKLILAGRSKRGSKEENKLKELESLGAEVLYVQADVGIRSEAEQLYRAAKQRYGKINGIIHCAGIVQDSLVIQKDRAGIEKVLRPKVQGTLLLDELFQEEPLRYFVLFSSFSAVAGSPGQADYAYANCFMDEYADRREGTGRPGKSLSINWPLWKEGGMQIDAASEEHMTAATGIVPLDTQSGLRAFEESLLSPFSRVIVLEGDERKIAGVMPAKEQEPEVKPAAERVQQQARTERTEQIKRTWQTVSAHSLESADEMAIIGLSGRYPMADNVNEFWENIKNGIDCITEIPKERWDYTKDFDPDIHKQGKSYTKWGGFMNDVDKFDPLFFNMSPREAEYASPQERLFLQTVWHAVEDAGYTRNELSKSNTGVFVGVMWEQYQLYGAEQSMIGNVMALSSSYATIANRVSYVFNFCGPSLAIDTMCSSSLSAIHYACESIRRGECEVAVAGGVNVAVHPNKYILLSQGKFASTDGKCRSFGEGGDGYVPGEGVGAVIIKPLQKAQADGDHIYGVIKSSSINHGGKTSGFTVPSPASQSGVISDAIKKANIDPRSISYIEAHGTGTSLGDPIEIAGLTRVFREYTQDKQFCSIGSIKSNIGHLESAAGIAGITKVLLQFKHQALAPSLHSEILNPGIPFESSPFYVQQDIAEWKQPAVLSEEGGAVTRYPRRAGISGFGAGGTNVHLILEEYPVQQVRQSYGKDNGPQIILLSAKTAERLTETVRQLLLYLRPVQKMREPLPQPAEELAATTIAADNRRQQIRLSVSELLAGVLQVDVRDLLEDENLLEYVASPLDYSILFQRIGANFHLEPDEDRFRNHLTFSQLCDYIIELQKSRDYSVKEAWGADSSVHSVPLEAEPFSLMDIAYTLQTGREALTERIAFVVSSIEELCLKLEGLLANTSKNADVYRGQVNSGRSGLGLLVDGAAGERFLETIVQNKELFKLAELWTLGAKFDWKILYQGQTPRRVSLPGYPFAKERYWVPAIPADSMKHAQMAATEALHPLIDCNTSTFSQQKFAKRFNGEEGWLRDHVLDQQQLLPGAVYLEMACEAVRKSIDIRFPVLSNIVWARPLIVNNDAPADVQIFLYPEEQMAEFEIFTEEQGQKTVYAQGHAVFDSKHLPEPEAVDVQAVQSRCNKYVTGKDHYAELEAKGFRYGSLFQTITRLYCSDTETLALLELPHEAEEEFSRYSLHPSLIDGAFQSVAGLEAGMGDQPKAFYMPFSLGEVSLWGELPRRCYAYCVLADGQNHSGKGIKKYNVSILDEAGRTRAFLKDFAVKEFAAVSPAQDLVSTDLLSLLKKLETGELTAHEAEQRMEVLKS
uniref:SDR family NAD(P)-dependent oxidoreductase n=1 Tax=Paenibacillus durus TaxID=44251 RepID=UPI000693D57E|nr:SDR family NAD(P)-dependent oxidoreductase [Paenibacillus durus]